MILSSLSPPDSSCSNMSSSYNHTVTTSYTHVLLRSSYKMTASYTHVLLRSSYKMTTSYTHVLLRSSYKMTASYTHGLLPSDKVFIQDDSVLHTFSFTFRYSIHLMKNRAEKDAIRWCYLTHQFIAGASVHSREPKARVAEVN